MDDVARLRQRLCDFAAEQPGAHVDFPWGERVVKVGRKIFIFLGSDDPNVSSAGIILKLIQSHDEAMATPGARPPGYGLARSGWVAIPLGGDAQPPMDVLEAWVVESYRNVAPKRLLAELDRSG